LVMVAAVIAFPSLVTGGIEKGVQIDADKALEQLQMQPRESQTEGNAPATTPQAGGSDAAGIPNNDKPEKEDPMKGLLESLKEEQQKK
jgi:hypothetical protein